MSVADGRRNPWPWLWHPFEQQPNYQEDQTSNPKGISLANDRRQPAHCSSVHHSCVLHGKSLLWCRSCVFSLKQEHVIEGIILCICFAWPFQEASLFLTACCLVAIGNFSSFWSLQLMWCILNCLIFSESTKGRGMLSFHLPIGNWCCKHALWMLESRSLPGNVHCVDREHWQPQTHSLKQSVGWLNAKKLMLLFFNSFHMDPTCSYLEHHKDETKREQKMVFAKLFFFDVWLIS